MNRSWFGRLMMTALPPLLFLVGVVLVWHFVVVAFDIKSYLIPRPAQVVEALSDNAATMLRATWMTTRVAVSGFACSLVLGVGIALVFAQFRWIRNSCYPYAIVLQTVPIVAIAPIIITWFGSGFYSIVIVATIISLFPIITNVTTGLISVPAQYVDLFRVHQATTWQTQFKLRFPFAVRYLVVGAKTSSGLTVVGAIVGEFFAGHDVDTPGLGYLISASSQQLQTAKLFAAVILATVLGIAVFLTMSLLSSTVFSRWTRVD